MYANQRYVPRLSLMSCAFAGVLFLVSPEALFGALGDGTIVTGVVGKTPSSLQISIICENADGTTEPIDVTVQLDIAGANDVDTDNDNVVSAAEKAKAIENVIDALAPGCFTAGTGILPDRVTLTAGVGNKITKNVVVKGSDTSLETIGTKITPVPDMDAGGKASYAGTPMGGSVSLSVGSIDATVADTTGMTAGQIMQSLADQLAGQLSGQGVHVVIHDGEIHVTSGLSDILFTASNTDPGLSLGVGVFEIIPVPAVSEWGLVVLTLLLMVIGTVVLARRRGGAAQVA